MTSRFLFLVALVLCGCDEKPSAKAPATQTAAKPALTQEDRDLAKLPAEIRELLDHTHAGWKLPVADEYVRGPDCFGHQKTPFAPSIVWGDFDANGSRDYAVQYEHGGTTHVEAFLANKEGGFDGQEIAEDAFDMIGVAAKGEEYFDHDTEKAGKYPAESVKGIRCEKSSRAYIFRKGKFNEITTSD